MSFVARDPERHAGKPIGSGHCVAFIQHTTSVGHTSTWRRGERVRDADNVPTGTAIATFDANGRYENDTTGRSHAAILIARQDDGLLVWDQWLNQPVQQRVIRYRGGQGSAVNDGDKFYIIEPA
jgi:hypothetical protein